MAIKKIRFAVPGGKVVGTDGNEYACTHIECEVRYSLGGMNYWNYRVDPRGYYAHVTPVKVDDRCGFQSVGFTMGSGKKFLLVPCARQSPKREAEAVAKFDADVRSYVAKLFGTDGIVMAA